MANTEREISTERNALSYGVAVRSLKRSLKTPWHRANVREDLAKAKRALKAATTEEARQDAQCEITHCTTELASLEAGNEPDVYSGIVHFQRPTPE